MTNCCEHHLDRARLDGKDSDLPLPLPLPLLLGVALVVGESILWAVRGHARFRWAFAQLATSERTTAGVSATRDRFADQLEEIGQRVASIHDILMDVE